MDRVGAGHLKRPLLATSPLRVAALVGAAACLCGWGAAGANAETLPAAPAAAGEDTHGPPQTIVELKALEARARRASKRVAPCVVAISGGGSGVVVSKDGYILSVAHLGVHAGRNVTITFHDGRRVRGRTLGNDHGVDAGVIKITDQGKWPCAEWGESGTLKVGQWCLTLGYPVTFDRGKAPALRIGRVLRADAHTIITDCKIMGGDSGGPLFDLDGRIIGIGSRCHDSVSINLSVPIDRFRDHWNRLIAGEDFDSLHPPIALLGVSPEENADADEPRIGSIVPGSAAEKAGIQAGDLILRFDGKPLRRYSELPPMVRQKKPGDTVDVEVRRGQETLKFEATLGERAESPE